MKIVNGVKSDYLQKFSNTILYKKMKVLPCDLLKNENFLKISKFIINLSPSNDAGSHYVALSIKKKTCIYFDPYGFPCVNKDILDVLEKNNKKIRYVSKVVQTSISYFCGYFCLSFLIFQENEVSIKTFASLFSSSDVKKNEKKCVEIIKRRIKCRNIQ